MENSIIKIIELIINQKLEDFEYRINYFEIWLIIDDKTIIIKKKFRWLRKSNKAVIKFSDRNILGYYLFESSLPIIKEFDVDISAYNKLKSRLLVKDWIEEQYEREREKKYEDEITDSLETIVKNTKMVVEEEEERVKMEREKTRELMKRISFG